MAINTYKLSLLTNLQITKGITTFAKNKFMERYNQVMLYFWLFAGAFGLIAVTYFGIQEGFDKWTYYYIFPGMAILMYFMRRYMMKRMQKHMEFLEEKEKNDAANR